MEPYFKDTHFINSPDCDPMTRLMNLPRICGVALSAALLLTSCKKAEVSYYEVPKETSKEETNNLPAGHPDVSQSDMSSPNMAGQLPAVDRSNTGLVWEVPTDFVAGRQSSQRLGSYTVEGESPQTLDISITRFPGNVGGLVANVNRWRGQLGLAPVNSEAEVHMHDHPAGTLVFKLIDLNNDTANEAMLIGLLEFQGNSWFFKMSGQSPLVSEQRDNFILLINSVKEEVH